MATAQVVITQSNSETPAIGGLFEGLSFFLVQRLPSRGSFVEKIQLNGGRVVRLENQADHVIADHYRSDCPAGSITYKFIEDAIKHGELPDADEYPAARPKGAVREAGSAIPAKSTRTPFTAQDDKDLWQWVERCREDGMLVKGNEIYKQLEARNGRHTFQAWRDRYIKKLIDRPPAGVEVKVAANAPPSPPTAQDTEQDVVETEDVQPQEAAEPPMEIDEVQDPESAFTTEELELLVEQGTDIEKICEEWKDEAWHKWAGAYPTHSAESWRSFWKDKARPEFFQRKKARRANRKRRRGAKDEPDSPERQHTASTRIELTAVEIPAATQKATPCRPLSSESQKRKRETSTPRAQQSYGRKKQISASAEIFGGDDSDEDSIEDRIKDLRRSMSQSPKKQSTQPIEILSDEEEEAPREQSELTSELNRAAQTQLEQEGRELAPAIMPPSRSDVDVQPDAQVEFDNEVLGISQSHGELQTHPMSNLPTSDINRAADQQVRRESVELQDEMEVEEEDSLPETPTILYSQSNATAQSPVADHGSVDLFQPKGDALTEANLASQQAQHKAELLRGSDLPQDEEDRDEEQQNQYVKYLQMVTKQSTDEKEPIVKTLQQQRDANAYPFQSNTPFGGLPVLHDLDPEDMGELPISSQQEIDGALEDMIQWPESPKNSPHKDPQESLGQSFRFDTQVSYPKLPEQRYISPEEILLSSQASLPPQPSYPSLPQDVSMQPQVGRQPQSIAEDESYVLVQNGSQPGSSQVEVGDGHVDLSLPAPEGGWDVSSPTKVLESSPARQMQRRRNDASGSQPELVQVPEAETEIVEEVQEVVELTSSSSSSSGSSNDESEPAAVEGEDIEERNKALETQDIMNAETQLPDFDMPLPPDSDGEFDELYSDSTNQPSSPPNAATLESQRALADTQKLPDDELNSYIDKMVVYGHKEASVIAALKCTSMRPDLAELVLLVEKAKKESPKDVAGIWSEEEDQVLESGNARGLRKLEEKHTWKECEERMQFLQEWRDEE